MLASILVLSATVNKKQLKTSGHLSWDASSVKAISKHYGKSAVQYSAVESSMDNF